MLSSEDAFSYAIARTEKIWFERSAVSRRSAVGKKKRNRRSVPIDAVPFGLRPEKKIIGVDSIKANIDCELRPKKDRNHMSSLKAKRSFGRE